MRCNHSVGWRLPTIKEPSRLQVTPLLTLLAFIWEMHLHDLNLQLTKATVKLKLNLLEEDLHHSHCRQLHQWCTPS